MGKLTIDAREVFGGYLLPAYGDVDIYAPLVFANLGTATKGIDLSGSGLSGSGDYWIYGDANNYWTANGKLKSFGESSFTYLYDVLGNKIIDLYTNRPSYYLNILANNTFAMIPASNAAFLMGNGARIGSWGGDGVSNGTTTITDIGGAAHGLSLAAGDLVHITAGTGAVEGFYRIVSDDGTSVVVDRAVTAATDLAVIFYKDVIGFFATDGTNGQRIMGYSHQDKPLQIGGDVLAATGHSLGAEDVLIGGILEVDGVVYFDNTVAFYTTVNVNAGINFTGYQLITDDIQIRMGTGSDIKLLYETADADANELILALPDGGATNVPVFVIGDQGIINSNLGWFNGQTIPRVAMVAADEGGYFAFGVDNLDILDIFATTGPVVEIDETKMSHKLQVTINGATYYIMLTQT